MGSHRKLVLMGCTHSVVQCASMFVRIRFRGSYRSHRVAVNLTYPAFDMHVGPKGAQ